MPKEFKGIMTALITPFTQDGELDEDGLRVLLRRQVEAGINGVAVVAGSGEYVNLSEVERSTVLEISVAEVAGRIPVIAGILETNTRDAQKWAIEASQLGADALLLLTPFYNKPSSKGIVSHFQEVSNAADVPIIVYNNPGRTGIGLSPDDYELLAKIPNLVGVKECNRDLGTFSQSIEVVGSKWQILSGEDDLLYPSLVLGADGGILTSSNVMPAKWVEMYQAFIKGDHEKAKAIHFEILPFFRAIYSYNHPALIKKSLTILDMPAGSTRLPLVDPTVEEIETLKVLLG